MPVIWAVGRMLKTKDPGFHRLYPKQLKTIMFGKGPAAGGVANAGASSSSSTIIHDNDDEEEGGVGKLDQGSCVPFLLPDDSKRV